MEAVLYKRSHFLPQASNGQECADGLKVCCECDHIKYDFYYLYELKWHCNIT